MPSNTLLQVGILLFLLKRVYLRLWSIRVTQASEYRQTCYHESSSLRNTTFAATSTFPKQPQYWPPGVHQKSRIGGGKAWNPLSCYGVHWHTSNRHRPDNCPPVTTSVILVVGFLIFSRPAFALNAGMGKCTAITVTLALVADFLLLPPIPMAFDRKKGTKADTEVDTTQPLSTHAD